MSRFAIVLALFMVPAAAWAGQNRVREISPDNEVQTALADLATSKENRAQRWEQLRNLGSDQHSKLTAQLVWFAAHNKDANARIVVGKALKMLDVPRSEFVEVVVPFLDSSDEAVRGVARELLIEHEDHSPTRPPDFSAYRALLESQIRAAGEPQASLVRHMYESDPGLALLTLMRSFQLRKPAEIKPILWAEHIVADLLWKRRYGFVKATYIDQAAVEQLEKLSRDSRWWVRLYVARIVRLHPELGALELVNRLMADQHALVRELIRPKSAD